MATSEKFICSQPNRRMSEEQQKNTPSPCKTRFFWLVLFVLCTMQNALRGLITWLDLMKHWAAQTWVLLMLQTKQTDKTINTWCFRQQRNSLYGRYGESKQPKAHLYCFWAREDRSAAWAQQCCEEKVCGLGLTATSLGLVASTGGAICDEETQTEAVIRRWKTWVLGGQLF